MRRAFHLLILLLVCALPACKGPSEPGTLAPNEDRQPRVPRQVLAFYYPWYGSPTGPSQRWFHWNPASPRPAGYDAVHVPKLGYYDSADTAVIRQHVRWAKEAGVDAFIASWWGQGTFEDGVMPALMRIAEEEKFQVTVFLEEAPSRAILRGQVEYLLARYGSSPAWLRADGRPVIFVYTRVINELSEADMVAAFEGTGVFAVGDGASFGKAAPFDGVCFYNPSGDPGSYIGALPGVIRDQHRAGRIVAAAVMPGYDDTGYRTPGSILARGNGAAYRRFWREAPAADWVTITSFNEWHEGSEIEPSVEDGTTYLDLTRSLGDAWRGE